MSTYKITVLKRMYNQDIVNEYSLPGYNTSPCTRFVEGQEFVLNGNQRPQNFRDWAWNDIHKVLLTLRKQGNFAPWMKDGNTIIACCTDGLKPVVFKVERIEEQV
jgi:uncharacterized repeat protein (TIGR04076 family)